MTGNVPIAYCKCHPVIIPSGDRVPVKSPHPTMRWRMWVILIAGSTRSALRVVRPPSSYNAEDGQIYTAQVSMQGERALQIQGCVPNRGLCGSETWTRVK